MPNGSIRSKALILVLGSLVFVLSLVVIPAFYVLRLVYKCLAYASNALRTFLAFMGEKSLPYQNEVTDAIETTGFSYDPSQDIFYSTMHPWQRKFGYCRLYDEACAVFGMIVDCEPVYFDYNGKKWLIEFWKGQYDLTTGCEIGIYSTEGPSLDIPGVFNETFYESGDNPELLLMSYTLSKNNIPAFNRYGRHWWLTGFKLGEFSKPSELTMKIRIMLRDQIMCDAFVKGLKKAGYNDSEINRNYTTVSFVFDKPRTRQPFTRTRFTDWLIQRKNKRMCKEFMNITGGLQTIEEKLEAVRKSSPKLYKKIMNIRMPEKAYRGCQKINSYIR